MHHHLVVQSIEFVPFCEISDFLVINKRLIWADLLIPGLELQVILQSEKSVHQPKLLVRVRWANVIES